jgi:hypothetical protein
MTGLERFGRVAAAILGLLPWFVAIAMIVYQRAVSKRWPDGGDVWAAFCAVLVFVVPPMMGLLFGGDLGGGVGGVFGLVIGGVISGGIFVGILGHSQPRRTVRLPDPWLSRVYEDDLSRLVKLVSARSTAAPSVGRYSEDSRSQGGTAAHIPEDVISGQHGIPAPDREAVMELGRFGRERRKFLEQFHPRELHKLRQSGELEEYLHLVDEEAEDEYQRIRWQEANYHRQNIPPGKEDSFEELEAVARAAHVVANSRVMREIVLVPPEPPDGDDSEEGAEQDY